MCSCGATSAAVFAPAGPIRSRTELGGLAMTVARRSRPTTGRRFSSGRSSFLFRERCLIGTRPDSETRRSAYTSSSGGFEEERPDRLTASQRCPCLTAQCFRRQRRTSLASQTGVALNRATGRGKSDREVQRPACAREVSRISATSASPARSSLCVRGIRIRCIHHECPGGAGTPRGRRRRVSFDAPARLYASHAASGSLSERGVADGDGN
jgi:hypothetical protein